MLAFAAVIFAFVAMFFREHHDYQYALLVPLHALAIATFLDWCALRLATGQTARRALMAAFGAACIGLNAWDQSGLRTDLRLARNAMVNLGVQRASATWLAERGVAHPIIVTFYAVGTYELLTGGVVRPIYAFPPFRYPRARGEPAPDFVAVWRWLFAGGQDERYAVLPLGENPIESRHFDEPAIRAALLEAADGERVAVFANQTGEPLLEIWRVRPAPL